MPFLNRPHAPSAIHYWLILISLSRPISPVRSGGLKFEIRKRVRTDGSITHELDLMRGNLHAEGLPDGLHPEAEATHSGRRVCAASRRSAAAVPQPIHDQPGGKRRADEARRGAGRACPRRSRFVGHGLEGRGPLDNKLVIRQLLSFDLIEFSPIYCRI